MFKKGDWVIYGNNGVCCVDDVGRFKDIPVSDTEKDYYKLVPLRNGGTIYIPADTSVFMRPVITEEEANALIAQMTDIDETVCDSKNQKILNDHYKASMDTHACEDLVCIIKSVYAKKQNSVSNGKKQGKTDQEYGKRAEELLYEELSVVLGIPYEKVQRYVEQEVEKLEAMKLDNASVSIS